MENPSLIESFIRNISVSGALLDRRGHIIEVSSGWKHLAEAANLNVDNYAIGQDYLKYAAFPDTSSIAILRGLRRLLNKDIDVFSTIYPCDTPTQQRWFALVGFSAGENSNAAAALLHVDISSFLQDRTEISASMIGVGAAALDPTIERLTRAVKEAVYASASDSRPIVLPTGNSREQRAIRSLTPNQLVLLSHLAQGASNSEIAKAQKIRLDRSRIKPPHFSESSASLTGRRRHCWRFETGYPEWLRRCLLRRAMSSRTLLCCKNLVRSSNGLISSSFLCLFSLTVLVR